MNLNQRLKQIESRHRLGAMHWIDPAYPGQPLSDAIAAFETTHGPMGPNDRVLHWDVFEAVSA